MIRKMTKKDYFQVYNLGSKLHNNYKNLYNLEELDQKDYYHTYVYEENKKILGFIMYIKIDNTIEFLDIYVEEKYRNRKIATQLINRMITLSEPYDKIYLEVSKENKIALQLYEKFGFKIINVRKKYYGKYDALIMERVTKNE